MSDPLEIYNNFKSRIQQDLIGWEDRLTEQRHILEGYQQTLKLIGLGSKLRVDVGSNFFMNGQRINNNIILKMMDNIFVEVSHDQALKIIPGLIKISEKKVFNSQKMIAYIMSSREQIDIALQSFNQ